MRCSGRSRLWSISTLESSPSLRISALDGRRLSFQRTRLPNGLGALFGDRPIDNWPSTARQPNGPNRFIGRENPEFLRKLCAKNASETEKMTFLCERHSKFDIQTQSLPTVLKCSLFKSHKEGDLWDIFSSLNAQHFSYSPARILRWSPGLKLRDRTSISGALLQASNRADEQITFASFPPLAICTRKLFKCLGLLGDCLRCDFIVSAHSRTASHRRCLRPKKAFSCKV